MAKPSRMKKQAGFDIFECKVTDNSTKLKIKKVIKSRIFYIQICCGRIKVVNLQKIFINGI